MAVNSAWGIDIGNRALKAIKLVRDGDGVRVDDFEVIEHENVLSNAGDNREALINAALQQLITRHTFKRETVGIGVSGQSSFARFIKLPPVETKKIPEIVRFEAIQQIPFPLDDVEWSYQLFTADDSPDVEVGIFAMRKELINQHISYFTEAELNVQVVQMNPLAVYNAMFYDGRIKGTTMIIDMGAENTDLIIADEHTIWLRSIPIGGNNFTETLVKSFKLNFAKAEDLKRNAASSKYARQIFQAMRPVFADLVAEVQRSIGFYASVHRDSRIKKILALGGTFKLPGLQKYLQQNLQLDVERLDNLGAGAPPDPKTAGAFNDNILSMVSAYGLALQAMGEGKLTSSLLPARIRREKLWQDKAKWFAAAAALFVLGTGVGFGAWFVHNVNYDSAAAERERIAQIQGQATTLDSEWGTIETSGAADRQRITNIRSLTEYRDLWPSLLVDIDRAIPKAPPDIAKKVPARNQREQITLESITSRYAPDLSAVLADPDFRKYADTANLPAAVTPQAPQGGFGAPGGFGSEFMDPALMEESMGGMGMGSGYDPSMGQAAAVPIPGATGGAGGQRGFLITVRGTTPFAEASTYINKTVVAALEAIDQKTSFEGKRPYYIPKAELVIASPLKQDSQRLAQMKQAYDAALRSRGVQPGAMALPEMDPGMPMEEQGFNVQPGQPGQLTPAQIEAQRVEEERKPFLDPATGEDMRDDLQFTVLFVALLDPTAPPPPAEGAAPVDGATPAEGAAPAEGQPPAPAEGQPAPAEGQPAPDQPLAPDGSAPAPPAPAEAPPAAPAAAAPPAPAPTDGQPTGAQQPPGAAPAPPAPPEQPAPPAPQQPEAPPAP